jgi:hypothetical protein
MDPDAIRIIYGILAAAMVATALALIAWGIVNERRDRTRQERAREIFGEHAARLEVGSDREVAASR